MTELSGPRLRETAAAPAEMKIVGAPRGLAGRRVCLFSASAPGGAVRPHAAYHLQWLTQIGLDVVLVLNVDRVVNRSWRRLAEGLAGLVVRRAAGTHFAAWADTFAKFPALWTAAAVLLTTDEMVGPVRDFSAAIDRAFNGPSTFIGLTQSHQGAPHFQPQFMIMKRAMLASGRVRDFWARSVDMSAGRRASMRNALALFTLAKSLNLQTEALFSHPGGANNAADPMAEFWRELLDSGCPYLRVDLFGHNGAAAAVLGRPELAENTALAAAVGQLLDAGADGVRKPQLDNRPVGASPSAADPGDTGSSGDDNRIAGLRQVYQQYRDHTLKRGRDAIHYGALSRRPVRAERCDVKLIAYYLPQFHPIPENDAFWGRGFTEWTNVSKATPVFVGHQQPRLPGEFGFYDLRVPETMAAQADLARQYGISAFCFHFYWFGGRTLLERPLENYLAATHIDLPFCLCWANENWTRRWDGREGDVLMRQSHSAEDDVRFIRYLGKYFADPRYLTVQGKPILTVYRPELLPEPIATIARWRDEAQRMGLPGLYLVATNAFNFSDHQRYGFDALSEFPPHSSRARPVNDTHHIVAEDFAGHVFDYADLVATSAATEAVGTVWPGVAPSWDNSPRRPLTGSVYHGSTPTIFRRWLDQAIVRGRANPQGERFVMVNAWNEWGEGAYLEPDQRFGYAYLAACRSAVADQSADDQEVVVLFARTRASFHAAGEHAVAVHLGRSPSDDELAAIAGDVHGIDTYLTVSRHISLASARRIVGAFQSVYIQEVDDRGRDMLALRAVFAAIRQGNYTFVCKLVLDGMKQSGHLIAPLLTAEARAKLNKATGKVGIVVPRESLARFDAKNGPPALIDHIKRIAGRLGTPDLSDCLFVEAAPFWFKPEALAAFVDAIPVGEFEPELDQTAGTFAHSLERMVIAAVRAAGFSVRTIEGSAVAA